MAQTGFTPISNYYSATATNVPTAGNLVAGELAINTNDGILYYKDSSGVVQSIASKAGNSGSFTNLSYTGTLTGGTGVVNLGSGQFYKDASGNVGIGTSSPAQKLDVVDGRIRTAGSTGNSGYIQIFNNANTTGQLQLGQGLASGTDNVGYLWNIANADMSFGTNNTERMRIDSSGNLLVGTTTATGVLTVVGGVTGGTSVQAGFGGVNATSFRIFHANVGGSNAALCVAKIEAVISTSRSINAAGTINALGTDYAEYMSKAGEFLIAKGDICGINSDGKLTNVFNDSVSFLVKSTNPSFVGGDNWGADLNDEELESARQTVDRIAFAGQAPVNVLGSIAGQYIIPINDNGLIKGQAVSNPTFEQYQIAVGKVIAIEEDGRARIIVKVS